MIIMKLMTAGLLGMVALSALAQAPSIDTANRADLGHRDSRPRASIARHIVSADTTSSNAPTPRSPDPRIDASTEDHSRAAQVSLVADHLARTHQSLEISETGSPGEFDESDRSKAHAIQIINASFGN